jgi:phosphotriesterase-related protein
MNRRHFLTVGSGILASPATQAAFLGSRVPTPDALVMTVQGPISPADMGLTLPHEHILVDFIGAEQATPDRYKVAEVIAVALPHLERIRALGVRTLVECTPSYLGRDPALLRALAERTGLHLLTNTGYYAAAEEKGLPAHARTETADELASRWLHEWREGIGETGIRPGFIKIGVAAGPLPPLHRKLVVAAARTHLASGLTIAAHTGNGEAALTQLDILRREGVAAAAFIWVHAQNEADPSIHVEAARQGAWVEFDGIGPDSISENVARLQTMKAHRQLGRVLISHDAGWYHVGEPGGGTFRPFDTIITRFLPELVKRGFTAEEIRRLTIDQPREAFTIRIRPAKT